MLQPDAKAGVDEPVVEVAGGAVVLEGEAGELCVEDPTIELGDETSRVFINAKGRREDASAEMRAFLDYLCGEAASSEITRDIDND